MDTNKKIREHISALCDGELSAGDLELAVAGLQTPEGKQAWDVYHHVGDVLRARASADLSPSFSARLAARLDAEPMPIRRRAEASGEAGVVPAVVVAPRS